MFRQADPHLLEGGQRSQDGSSDPDGVLPLGRSDDLDLYGGGREGGDLLLHPVSDPGVHGAASGEDSVGVQVLTDVHIAPHGGVVDGLVNAAGFHSEEGRLEDRLRAPEPLVSDGDDLSVGKLIGLLKGARCGGHLLLEVEGDIAELLLDVPDDLTLRGGREGVAALGEDLHEIVCEITTSKIQTEYGVGPGESIAFIDGDSVGDEVSGVHDDTVGSARGVEGEYSLDGDVHGGGVEGL